MLAYRLSLDPHLSSYLRLTALLAVFSAAISLGQVQVQGPSSIYDGQKVSAIDLIANPHRNIAPFREVVLQKAGEPYSQQKVEASIEALQKAGGFPKVSVNVVPDIQGLRLNFLLEPAYFIGIVEFPGAARAFAYIRLLQVANLQDEDPYDSGRVEIAKKALQDFFARNGYFQSDTESETEIDDAHQLVNVVFRVQLGKRARVGGIEIQGTNEAETARLLHSMRSLRARLTGGLLKPGKPYTAERTKAAVTEIKRELTKQLRLASSVEENPPEYDSTTNRAKVSFK